MPTAAYRPDGEIAQQEADVGASGAEAAVEEAAAGGAGRARSAPLAAGAA